MNRVRNFFERTASRVALSLAAAGLHRETKLETSRKVAKGKPFGRYIAHVATPMNAGGEQLHSFLHPGKGWRTFNRIPAALLATAARTAKDTTTRDPQAAKRKPAWAEWRSNTAYRGMARNQKFGRAA